MLCGDPPFDGRSFREVVSRNKKCIIDFRPIEDSGVSSTTMELLRSLLDEKPERRPSCEQCLEHVAFNLLNNSARASQTSIDFKYTSPSPGSAQHNLRVRVGDQMERQQRLSSSNMSDSDLMVRSPVLNGRIDTMLENSAISSRLRINSAESRTLSPVMNDTRNNSSGFQVSTTSMTLSAGTAGSGSFLTKRRASYNEGNQLMKMAILKNAKTNTRGSGSNQLSNSPKSNTMRTMNTGGVIPSQRYYTGEEFGTPRSREDRESCNAMTEAETFDTIHGSPADKVYVLNFLTQHKHPSKCHDNPRVQTYARAKEAQKIKDSLKMNLQCTGTCQVLSYCRAIYMQSGNSLFQIRDGHTFS
eukprot:TRINITY_DN9842_c0_g1_i2.p1 TRINITY_DN9842_c0_g1~~TRINITY_DN9842_c0_g1_i2.p1  ORF type:complete len:358 (-),score=14.52 TRINITY_DN9842_c0_g1_i2:423-1496(-)